MRKAEERKGTTEQIHGGDIYRHPEVTDFSVNSNPLGPPKGVIQALEESLGEIACYPDMRCEKLREAIGQFEQTPPEAVLCGNGAAELFFAAAWAQKPRKGLVTAPAFSEYERALGAAGGQTEFYELREEQEFEIGADFLERINPEVDLVFLCSPNNPTGWPLEQDFVNEALERCRACGARLVLDECFIDFLEDPGQYEARDLIREYPELLVVKAFTKSFAMPGLRLGYALCGDRKFLERMQEMLQPWNVSLPAQIAGVAALQGAEGYLEETRKVVARGRAFLREGLEACGFPVYGSRANYVFFKGRPGLYREALAAGFLIRDCGNYRGLPEGFFRVAVRTEEENERLMAWLRRS